MRHGFVSHGFRTSWIRPPWRIVQRGFVRHGIVQRGFVRRRLIRQRSCTSKKKRKGDRRARESSEQRKARLSRRRLADRERARARRGTETATQREVRLARRRIADRSRRVSQSQSTEEREACLHQLRVKRAKHELTNDAAFKFWSCFSPIVEQISESDHVTIKILLFSEKFDAEDSPTEIITKIYR